MVDRVLALEEGTRLFILAPIVRGRKGEYSKEMLELQKKGFQRVKVDGAFYEIADAPTLDKKYKHDIDVVVDRLVVRGDLGTRLADSIETALRLADGICVAEFADRPLDASQTGDESVNKSANETHERMMFSEKFACPVSGFTIPEIEPRLFSFNNPFGACPTCDGLGSQRAIDAKPDRPRRERHAALRRRQPVGEVDLALLRPDAGGARQGLWLQARRQVQGPARGSQARHPARHRQARDHLPV